MSSLEEGQLTEAFLSLKDNKKKEGTNSRKEAFGKQRMAEWAASPSSPGFPSRSILVRHSILPFGEHIDLFDLKY